MGVDVGVDVLETMEVRLGVNEGVTEGVIKAKRELVWEIIAAASGQLSSQSRISLVSIISIDGKTFISVETIF